MADEVYQENVYQDERPFVSARKVMAQMGEPYASSVELLSFHTVSKVGAAGLSWRLQGSAGGCRAELGMAALDHRYAAPQHIARGSCYAVRPHLGVLTACLPACQAGLPR